MFTPVRAISAAAAAALVALVAVPALTSAQTGDREIQLREKVRAAKFVHNSPSTRGQRLAMGDRVITRQLVFDASDKQVGTLTTDCINVGRRAQVFKATLQCTSVYRFADGQVVAAGVVTLSDPDVRFPIVGGSGAYRGASGESVAGPPAQGYDTTEVMHLDG
jgi:hypothetical protein